MPTLHGTTILAVRHQGVRAMAGDGQVPLGQTVLKQGARNVRPLAASEGGAQGVTVEAALVRERLAPLLSDRDLTRFIL